MAESTILTGQFVRINQVPASVGDRIVAALVDYTFMFIYLLSTFYIINEAIPHLQTSIENIVFFLVIYIPLIGYPLLMEVFNNGQTLGKMLLGIRVVKADGSTPTLANYLMRWLLLPIDVPFTSGLGVVVMLLNKSNQRLGDLAAGTIVVKEKNYKKIQVSLDEFDFLTENYQPTFPQAADLSLEQINVINKTLDTPREKRFRLVAQLAQKIRERLSIPPSGLNDEQLLETLIRDYQYYALEII